MCKEYLKKLKNEKVKVVLLGSNYEQERISLGIKQLSNENFKQEVNELEAGQKVSCIVRNIRKDFMEVEIDLGLKGIIKKIDVSADKKEQKTDKFTVGEKLDANIISFDNETGKLMLALKSLEDVEKNTSQEDDEELNNT